MNAAKQGWWSNVMSGLRSERASVRRAPRIEELEMRILYSADLAPIGMEHVHPTMPVERRVLSDDGEFIATREHEQYNRVARPVGTELDFDLSVPLSAQLGLTH